jgi:excisionase family DNA binding protein
MAQVRKSSRYVTLEEAAARLSVSTRTMRRILEAGEIQTFKAGRVLRLSEVDLEKYITSNTY